MKRGIILIGVLLLAPMTCWAEPVGLVAVSDTELDAVVAGLGQLEKAAKMGIWRRGGTTGIGLQNGTSKIGIRRKRNTVSDNPGNVALGLRHSSTGNRLKKMSVGMSTAPTGRFKQASVMMKIKHDTAMAVIRNIR